VLVFEDLHWADDSLLDFIDHLVDWAAGVPLLVVCTARPELLARRPGWGGGKPNAATISLSPLSDDETARLVHALLERSVLPAELQTTLIDRAGGNPLYAEEFARMVDEIGESESGLRLPESVQGLIAARLDALPLEEKLLLQDASVVGKVFWLGALARIGGRNKHDAELLLHQLERKEFVRRERRSSVGGESQYVFSHLLVGDVAYSQIPRGARSEKHRGAADWIESLGRPEDHAEMLAHHYLAALELERAAGADTSELSTRARLRLREAGDRAEALSAYAAAHRFYVAALELWPEDDSGRPGLLYRYARSLHALQPTDPQSLEVITGARDALLSAGETGRAAEAEVLMAEVYWLLGERDRGLERLEAAEMLVADHPTSYSKAYVLANISRFAVLAGDSERGVQVGRVALAMGEELGDDSIRAHALNNMGIARVSVGDRSGIDELEQSAAIAVAANSTESVRSYGNLASILTDLGELERAKAMLEKAVPLGERFGVSDWQDWIYGELCWHLYFEGRWDEAAPTIDEFISRFTPTGFWMETPLRWLRGVTRLARGDLQGAQEDAGRVIERAEAAKDPQVLWPALAFGARAFLGTDPQRARRLSSDLLDTWQEHGLRTGSDSEWLSHLAVALVALGEGDRLSRLIAESTVRNPWREAAAAYVSGDLQKAADIYGSVGARPEEAYARLRAAESLVAEGRRAQADAQLEPALAFWRSVGASAYVQEGEALLAKAG
jgi:tetratricopeptide (TPR) repeat protein